MLRRSWQDRTAMRADALSAGRYDLLVEEYAYPLTVYVGREPQVVADKPGAWAFFQAFHAMLAASGISKVTARVVAEDLPRGGRSRVWCDWYGEGADGRRRRFASTVCYARETAGEPLTEMLEFTRLDLPKAVAA